MVIATGTIFLYFLLRYVVRLAPLGGGLYSIIPYWTGKPLIQFGVEHSVSQIVIEFSYSLSM